MTEHFFVVGAQRSGTTYLYAALDEHPEITMARPVRPEPKFFVDDEQYGRGLDWYETRYWEEPGGRLLGEKSVGYLESGLAVDRIAGAYPAAPILAMLSNPVDRAVSNYGFSVENGVETLPIEEALTVDEDERAAFVDGWWIVDGHRIQANPFAYRRRSRYIEDLRLWAARFPREQMWVGVFEETVGSEAAIAGLYEFLGVDPGFRPSVLGTVVNPGSQAAGAGMVGEDLRARLRGEFSPFNEALSAEFYLDLSSWD